MKTWLSCATLAAAVLATAYPATAAEPTAPRLFQLLPQAATDQCAARLDGTGNSITFAEPLTEDLRNGLSAGAHLALQDVSGAGTWPAPQIEAAPPCPLARFEAAGVVWTLSGGSDPTPLRWVTAPGRREFLFLARGPALADAAQWSRSRRGFVNASHPSAYYLVSLADGLHFVFKVYDAPPETRRLADDAAEVLEGRPAPLAAYDPAGGAVSLFRETVSGSQADIFAPGELSGQRPATLFIEDGRLFRGTEDGAVLRGSGLRCPANYGPLERRSMLVMDVSDDSLDLGCHWAGEDGELTVFVTRAPDVSVDKAYFADEIRRVQEQTGLASKLSDPPTGRKQMFQAGKSWLDKDMVWQAVLLARRGEYIIEIRISDASKDLQATTQAFTAFSRQFADWSPNADQ